MRLITPFLMTLVLCAYAPSASAVDPGATAMGVTKAGPGVKGEPGPSAPSVYTCDVNDWSKPVKTLTRPGGLVQTPPANAMWSCPLPRKSGGYSYVDRGAPCTCDVYGARWAGKIQD